MGGISPHKSHSELHCEEMSVPNASHAWQKRHAREVERSSGELTIGDPFPMENFSSHHLVITACEGDMGGSILLTSLLSSVSVFMSVSWWAVRWHRRCGISGKARIMLHTTSGVFRSLASLM